MKKVDFKEMVLDAYCQSPCPEENKKVLSEIAEVEEKLFATLDKEQMKLYQQIDFLKGELDVLSENCLVGFVLDILKSIFS